VIPIVDSLIVTLVHHVCIHFADCSHITNFVFESYVICMLRECFTRFIYVRHVTTNNIR